MNQIENCYKVLSQLISSGRKIARLTQTDLAKIMNISRVSVCNIECGRQRVQFHHAMLLSQLLNIDLNLPKIETKKALEIAVKAKREAHLKKQQKLINEAEKINEQLEILEEHFR